MSDGAGQEPGHASLTRLEQHRAGILDQAARHLLERHLASCAACQARLQELDRDAVDFAKQRMGRVRARLQEARSGRGVFGLIWLPASAVAVAFLALVVWGWPGAVVEDDHLLKGRPVFQVFARRSEQVFAVEPGASLQPGDEVRFVVHPAGLRYLIILSRDGAGQCSCYFPYGGSQSVPVPQERQELPGSIVLDGVLGEELVWAVFSKEPVGREEACRAVARGAQELAELVGPGQAVPLRWNKVTR